ncbi:glycoside hydrolase/deacetylase [Acaromyces ingoldii]|uniref:chitin deacetylase n=1 Tax=Acaromyces ingoldii TaxID=215250 RepID=A0A316YQK4_9BASI|nr:glycoside hydrolase/deacetylase [Acaromyces ingoldii]PWN90313.1 glycoside hydrolase/deacetylase [Acaromyces ingoldii]
MKYSIVAAALALSTAGQAVAHIGRGVPHNLMDKRDAHGAGSLTHVKRAPSPSVTDEASAATNTVAAQECQAYSLPEVAAMKSSFPTVWQSAAIVSGDTAANNVWNEIQQSGIIPSDVKQKGTGGKGDFTSVTPTYSKSDPDCWWSYNNCVTPKHSKIPDDIYQCPEPETWGLTFDDGPNCSHNAFYDFLRDNKQKASLFYIGSNVMDWPLEAQRGIVEGHHVCVHTWSHQYMTQLDNPTVFAELYYTAKAIKDITGVTPRCWRPPFGDVDDRVRAIATGLGLSTNIWTDDTDDWKIEPQGTLPKSSIDANYNKILSKDYSTTGNIVLTHEIDAETMAEFMSFYPQIQKKFKNIVPITACMNETKPYPEDITYPNFADYVKGNIEPSGIPTSSNIKVQPSASYDPIAAASETSASGDSTGGSASSSQKSQSTTTSSSAPASAAVPVLSLIALVSMAFALTA